METEDYAKTPYMDSVSLACDNNSLCSTVEESLNNEGERGGRCYKDEYCNTDLICNNETVCVEPVMGAHQDCTGCCIKSVWPDEFDPDAVNMVFIVKVKGCRFNLKESFPVVVIFERINSSETIKASFAVAFNNTVIGILTTYPGVSPGFYNIKIQARLEEYSGYTVVVSKP